MAVMQHDFTVDACKPKSQLINLCAHFPYKTPRKPGKLFTDLKILFAACLLLVYCLAYSSTLNMETVFKPI
jgi:hypothetical protein